jgi:hypothetical protein
MVVAEMVRFEFVVGVLMVAGVVKGIVVAVVAVAGIFSNRCPAFVAQHGDEGVHAREHSRLWRLNGEMFRVVWRSGICRAGVAITSCGVREFRLSFVSEVPVFR